MNDRKERVIAHQKLQLELAKIPMRFKDCTIDNWKVETPKQQAVKLKVQSFCDKFLELMARGIGGLILFGNVGTGKTHLAIGMAKQVISTYNASSRYVNVFDLISEIRATWNRPDKHEDEVIGKFCCYHLLVIDEIGVQYGTNAEQVLLFQIINERSLKKLPTILISNLDESQLKDCIGERTVDRIFENGGGSIGFTWNSYRRRTKKQRETIYE